MIVNMACPKCGGQASEYDAGKWACLKCGNKFLYEAPPPPSPTILNTSVSIQGSGLFDLDTSNARPPIPIFTTRKNRYQSHYAEQWQKHNRILEYAKVSFATDKKTGTVLGYCSGICFLGGGVFLCLTGFCRNDDLRVSGVMGLLVGVGCLIGSLYQFKEARNHDLKLTEVQKRGQELHAEENEDIPAGVWVCCPFCGASSIKVEDGQAMPTGLQHCLKCGKQFFTSQGYSYPLVLRQSPSASTIPPPIFAPTPQPTLKRESIGCPLCGQPLLLSSISAGRNKCPRCAGVFTAE